MSFDSDMVALERAAVDANVDLGFIVGIMKGIRTSILTLIAFAGGVAAVAFAKWVIQ